jgi:fibrillarin-like pre-rRNA processing protein
VTQIRKDQKRNELHWVRFDDGTERPVTASIASGAQVYGEQIITKGGREFRVWDPYRSKLAASLVHGLTVFAFTKGASVLYLGASSGTTASHVSDLVGVDGIVYCVEFAPRVMRDLLQVCTTRANLVPIFADAYHPEDYLQIPELVDILYQDVAQPDQAEILIRNAGRFLKPGGTAYLAVKARSIDVVAKPRQVFQKEEQKLAQAGFTIVDRINLEPFSSDHILISAIFSGEVS